MRAKIVATALEFPSEDAIHPRSDETAVAKSTELFAPGDELRGRREPLFWDRITRSMTGVTIISAGLAFVFGILSDIESDSGEAGQDAENLIDIAKIVAGAVVGPVDVSATGLAHRT